MTHKNMSDINEVAIELTNKVIDEIYHITKERQEEKLPLEFTTHNEYFSTMEVGFPDDDFETESLDEYFDNMEIVVNYEYTDEEGLTYEEQATLGDLDLSTLLTIYNIIKN